MRYDALNARRPDVDLELLADYDALFSGGKTFAARARYLLPQRPAEPDALYSYRIKCAHYLNYAGPIVSRFPAWLFTGRMSVRAEPVPPDDFYTDLSVDCDGIGTNLTTFMRERLTRALVQRRSWVLVDFPTDAAAQPAETRAEWSERGLGNGYLCPLDDGQVLDWEADERGELLWACVHHIDKRRVDPMGSRTVTTETWTFWGRDEWRRFEVKYENAKPPSADTEIAEVARGRVATAGHVPLVRVEVPDELWVMNLLASAQTEQMRSRNAESWGLQRTCYAMRIFKLKDKQNPPVHGAGFGMMIDVDENVVWDAPPSDAFVPISAYSERLKEELHRVASQMAYGVNYTAAATGRSAQSKGQDNKLFDIVLGAYGEIVCEAVEKIYDMLSLGRGDPLEWRVSGLDSFDVDSTGDLVNTAVAAQTLNIPSPTFQRLLARRVALSMVPDASDEERDTIGKEIDDNTPDEIEEPVVVDSKVEAAEAAAGVVDAEDEADVAKDAAKPAKPGA